MNTCTSQGAFQKSEPADQISHFANKVLSPLLTDTTLLDVTCCVCLHTLFHVVACFCMLLGVVMQGLKLVKLLATCKWTQKLGVVASVCT